MLAEAGVEVPPLEPILRRGEGAGDLLGFMVEPESAVALWERIRGVTDRTGLYPLIIVGIDDLQEQIAINEEEEPVEGVLAAAAAWTDAEVEAWFSRLETEDPEVFGNPERGEWEGAPQEEFMLPVRAMHSEDEEAAEDVAIVLIPCAHGWEVPAHVQFGGFNDCPFPAEHAAILRRWHTQYGAEIVTMASDTIEMRVARPPKTREGALALAREQFLYTAGDLVLQGTGTLDALGACLEGAGIWFFWWD